MKLSTLIKERISSTSRTRKTESFYSFFKNGMTVLDVGVSSERASLPPTENYFLKKFRYAPEYYTGLGIEDLTQMSKTYPGKRFVQYPGGIFPFEDKQFDWVFSNAVIEHVGDDDAQLGFMNEMMRVGKNCFFTTPNKYFPVETHTNVLFLHWADSLFHRWCSKRHWWVSKYDPYLFSYSRLKEMLDSSRASAYAIQENRFCGLVMTFTVVSWAL